MSLAILALSTARDDSSSVRALAHGEISLRSPRRRTVVTDGHIKDTGPTKSQREKTASGRPGHVSVSALLRARHVFSPVFHVERQVTLGADCFLPLFGAPVTVSFMKDEEDVSDDRIVLLIGQVVDD